MRYTKSFLLVTLLVPTLAHADWSHSSDAWKTALRTTFAQEGTDLGALYCPLTENTKCLPAGKEITTTRPSICMTYTGSENAPGGASWVTRGEDEACVDSQGLQAFGGFTNYWTDSANPEAWGRIGSPTVVANAVTDDDPAAFEGVVSASAPPADGSWVAWCDVRAGTADSARIITQATGGTGGNTCEFKDIPTTTTRLACPATLAGGTVVTGRILVGRYSNVTGSIHVEACGLTKTPHPMPRHDCGPSPCSRAGEVHTVSTEGWPVEAGEVRLQYTPVEGASATPRYLLSAETFGLVGWTLYIRDGTKGLAFLVANGAGGSTTHLGSALTWTAGQTYDIRVVWGGGMVRVFRDGLLALESSGQMPPGPLPSDARVGGRPGDPNRANGHIRLLRVSAP